MLNRRLMMLSTAAGAMFTSAARANEGFDYGAAGAVEAIDLWPTAAPGGEKVTVTERVVPRNPEGDPNDTAWYHVTKPWLIHRVPKKPNGAAILIIPGGGYRRVAVRKTGSDLDQWFADQGYHAYVMNYRLPADGWAVGPLVALQDAQRAIRLIRSRAAQFDYDPQKVAISGFSAGGHVAGLAATRFDTQSYAPVDAVDAHSVRPDVVVLSYGVLTMTEPFAHTGSVTEALGATPTVEARNALSIEQHVPADAPPAFIWSTTDDPVVPATNSILAYQAWKAQNLTAELHLYEGNTHGQPLRDADGRIYPWVQSLDRFVHRHLSLSENRVM